MTLRKLISRLFGLPLESRVKQHFMDGRLNRDQNILVDILDTLDQIAYYTSVTTAATVSDRKALSKVHKDRPKPRTRPGEKKEVKEKKQFASTSRAQAMLNQWSKRTVIKHIPGCHPVDGQCACPRELVTKT